MKYVSLNLPAECALWHLVIKSWSVHRQASDTHQAEELRQSNSRSAVNVLQDVLYHLITEGISFESCLWLLVQTLWVGQDECILGVVLLSTPLRGSRRLCSEALACLSLSLSIPSPASIHTPHTSYVLTSLLYTSHHHLYCLVLKAEVQCMFLDMVNVTSWRMLRLAGCLGQNFSLWSKWVYVTLYFQ